jgi:hypothetical protein
MKLSDRVANWFGGLSTREQRLLGILGVMAVFFVVFLFGYTIYTSFSAIDERIARAQELTNILDANKEAIATKYANGGAKKERDPVPKLTSFLDEISSRKSVPVQNYGGEKSLPTKDKKYTETSMEVRLAKVTLQQLVDFLQELENADQAAYTKQIEINIPRKDQRDSFDVVLTVATYDDPNAKKEDKTKTSTSEETKEAGADTKLDPAEAVKGVPSGGYGTAKGSSGSKDGAEPSIQGLPASPKLPRALPEVKENPDVKVEAPKGILGRRPFLKNTLPENKEATPENQ